MPIFLNADWLQVANVFVLHGCRQKSATPLLHPFWAATVTLSPVTKEGVHVVACNSRKMGLYHYPHSSTARNEKQNRPACSSGFLGTRQQPQKTVEFIDILLSRQEATPASSRLKNYPFIKDSLVLCPMGSRRLYASSSVRPLPSVNQTPPCFINSLNFHRALNRPYEARIINLHALMIHFQCDWGSIPVSQPCHSTLIDS